MDGPQAKEEVAEARLQEAWVPRRLRRKTSAGEKKVAADTPEEHKAREPTRPRHCRHKPD